MHHEKLKTHYSQLTTKTVIILALTIACLLLPQTAQAAEYYLDAANGLDTNTGTSDAPWKTLGRAYTWYSGTGAKVADGDTVLFRNGSYGTYTERSNVWPTYAVYNRTDWVTYKAAAGHAPQLTNIIIDNYLNATNCTSYLKFNGFTVGPFTTTSGVIYMRKSTYNQFLNLTIIGNNAKNTSYGIYGVAGCSDIVIDHCIFKGVGTGRFDGFDTAILATDCNNLIVTNNDIKQFHYQGVFVSSLNVNISNNDIHFSGADADIGITTGNGPLLIENNKIHDLRLYEPTLSENPTTTTWNAAGTVMTNSNATWEVNEPIAWVGVPNMEIWIISGTNVITGDKNNRIVSVDSPTQITLAKSIKLDPNGPTPSNVVYRIIDEQHTDTIQAYRNSVIKNVAIKGNQFYDCEGQMIFLTPTDASEPNNCGGYNFLIENNLFWNTYTDYTAEWSANAEVDAINGVTFRNNTVMGRLTFASCINLVCINNIVGYINATSTYSTANRFDYNIYNHGFITSPYFIGAHDVFLNAGYSWDKWNDPAFTGIFTNYASGDFTYASATSLAVGHGDPENSSSTDILGNLRNDGAPDAGCYEYGAISSTTTGDINSDGSVDAVDLQLLINMILSGGFDSKADLNKDSAVNAVDLQALVNIILGQ